LNLGSGSMTFTGTQSLNFGTGNVTVGATGKTITVNANTLTLGGAISSTGGTLSKAGAGTLILNGAAGAWTAGSNISNGVLQIGNKTALGTGTIAFNSATVGSISTLQSSADFSSANKLTNALTVANTQGTAVIGGANNLEIGGQVILTGGGSRTLTINNSG